MKYIFGVVFLSILVSSCNINRNVMFKTDRDYTYDTLAIDSTNKEYRIAPNDFITFQLFTNEGALILEFTASSNDRPRYYNFQDFTYPIEADGYCDLPSVGRTYLAGMTISEAQTKLEDLYRPEFNFPYALVRVMNRRVIVFPGTGSEARVIPLTNNNTTILEALASAGGLAQRADARKVKLIRHGKEDDEVYLMDLSTIDGIRYAQMTVQSGDVIYVEPTPDLAAGALRDISPYVSIISGVALIYALVTKGF